MVVDYTRPKQNRGGFPALTTYTPAVTYLERSSIPVEQYLGLLHFENKGKLAELPGKIGVCFQQGNS